MTKERLVVTQALCDHVKILLKGGAKMREAGQLTGISQTTVSRIRSAGFDAVKYAENTDRRRIEDNNAKADKKIAEALEQLQGQMKMELPEEEEKPQEMTEQTKMMRFQAGQVALLLQKLEKMNDMMGQILRAVRKE